MPHRRPADRTAGSAPSREATSIFGPACLSRIYTDAFGSWRVKPQYMIYPVDPATETQGWREPLNASALGRQLVALGANEIYVKWPRWREAELDFVLEALRGAGFQREILWPVLAFPSACGDDLMLRASKQDSARTHPFDRGGAAGQQRCMVTDHHRNLIASLQSEIEAAAEDTVVGSAFDERYGVARIMTVGSTSRGTYSAFPPDFDLVIHTERERTSIETADARCACERLIERLVLSSAFKRFGCAIAEWAGTPRAVPPSVALESLGARGLQSLVGRYDLVWRDPAIGNRFGFLDVTFGKLPQLIGYEIWIRRFFEALGPSRAELLQAEIRLAKTLVKQLGHVYGSANRGLRPHAIEQLIIQSFSYRSSGILVGTLDNALRLLVEEGGTVKPDGRFEVRPFEEFKARFPLWHPGWWEGEEGFRAGARNVNLWDLLGDGAAETAAPKWLKLFALGLAYDRSVKGGEPMYINGLAQAANAMLALNTGCQLSLGS